MWKIALKIIASIVSIVAFVKIVWLVAVYFNKLEAKIDVITTVQQTQQVQINKIEDQMPILETLVTGQTGLKNSWKLYLKNDSALTKKDFIIYMQALEAKKNE